jgi:peroxiredoxin
MDSKLSRRLIVQSGLLLAGSTLRGQDDFTKLPANLPVPMDDGECDHLLGMVMPSIFLPSTHGDQVDLSRHGVLPRTILYLYPRTGEPGKPSPDGWDAIPGARGCTPQSCSMRDNYRAMRELGAEVHGVSTQTTDYQSEAATRMHLPFSLLSDNRLRLTHALRLPTFQVNGWTLIKRHTIVLFRGRVEKVFYPVFPPDKHGEQVKAWLNAKTKGLI